MPDDLCRGNKLGFKVLRFSPQERFLGGIRSQDDRQNLVVWNLATKELKNLDQVFNGGNAPVFAFSPSDKLLAWTRSDKKIVLHSLSNQATTEIDVPEQPYALVFSPDEKVLAIHCTNLAKNKAVCIFWYLPTRTTIEKELSFKARYQTVVTGRTGRTLAFCVRDKKSDKKIALYHESPGASRAWYLDERSKFIMDVPDMPTQMSFSPDEQLLAVACGGPSSDRLTYIILDIPTRKEKARFVSSPSRGKIAGLPVLSMFPTLAFNPAGNLLAIGHGMGNISVLDPATGKETLRLESAHKTPVYKIIWQPDGRQFTSVTHEGTLKIWKLSGDSPISRSPFERFSKLAFSPDGQWLAAQVDRRTRLIHRPTGKLRKELPAQGPMLFRGDGRKLAVLAHDDYRKTRAQDFILENARALIFDVATGAQEAALELEFVQSAAFGPDGDLLVAGMAAKAQKTGAFAAEVWNVDKNTRIWQAPAESRLSFAILSPDGARVLGVEYQEGLTRLELWETATGQSLGEQSVPRVSWSGAMQPPTISPDGRWAAMPMRADGKLGRATAVFRLPSLEKGFEMPATLIPALHTFSADGRLLARCHFDGTICIWHVERGEELFRFQAASALIDSVCFSPEGDLAFAEKNVPEMQILRLESLRTAAGRVRAGMVRSLLPACPARRPMILYTLSGVA